MAVLQGEAPSFLARTRAHPARWSANPAMRKTSACGGACSAATHAEGITMQRRKAERGGGGRRGAALTHRAQTDTRARARTHTHAHARNAGKREPSPCARALPCLRPAPCSDRKPSCFKLLWSRKRRFRNSCRRAKLPTASGRARARDGPHAARGTGLAVPWMGLSLAERERRLVAICVQQKAFRLGVS